MIEGAEFGVPLNCQDTLRIVFTSNKNISAEADYLTKYGFINRKALIPGDNQIIDKEDIKTFFKSDEKKALQVKRDIEVIDILQFYYQELLNGGSTPLQSALDKLKHWNGNSNYDFKSFSDYYKKLNKRDLPTNPKEIRDDITPSAFSKNPLGTNAFVDMQSDLRNKALMRAIEISNSKFKAPTAVFGMGHLEQLGPTIEKHLGKPTLDYKPICP